MKVINKHLKISIITPSYNQAEYLEKTILSVLNQNYPNLEYIIIDGGSTDGSVDIIIKYEKYLTYWISEPDKGQADALNKGFAKASGDLIGWQNSDDVYLDGCFEKVSQVFNDLPDTDIVFGDMVLIDEKDNRLDEIKYTPFSVLSHLYEGMALSNQGCFWRKRLFDKIGMLDPKYQFSMDYEYFLRAGVAKVKFQHIRGILGGFRQHADAKTQKIALVSKQDHMIIDRLYGKKGGYYGAFLKIISVLRRSYYYLIQGDALYLFRGLLKRIVKGHS